ncbi:MAG TPA: hypothetical protein VMD76_14330 [Candidatus Sulfotelmatobacter sp.]|jgi:hypothetical protein|nr:hypothetical protein [Candidatus Sulfotelmatobacter sp.]
MKKSAWRAVVETAFIVFLFYSNLLMGEFTRSGAGEKRGLLWALRDVVTPENLVIAIMAALIGHALVEALRDRL